MSLTGRRIAASMTVSAYTADTSSIGEFALYGYVYDDNYIEGDYYLYGLTDDASQYEGFFTLTRI